MKSSSGVWGIVPVKSLRQSKSRLRMALSVDERVALSLDMLERVLSALRGCHSLEGWMVVSRDETALALAEEWGGLPLKEKQEGLNSSLCQAASEACKLGGESILVVPGDVPLLTPQDIDSIVFLAQEKRSAVIAPSRRRDGTNALLLRPPDLIPFSFGLDSFDKHTALAREAGVAVHIYSSETVAFDVDTEEDWRELTARLGSARIERT